MDWISVLALLKDIPGRLCRFWGRPALEVYYDKNETYHTRKTVDREDAHGFYCHVMVRNKGKSTARMCQGRLIAVEVVGDKGQVTRHPDFVNPTVLKWAHEPDYEPKDIKIDLPRRLDLCYVISSSPDVLSFFADKRPSGNRTNFQRGVYRVTIRVDGEGIEPSVGRFLVKHMGDWNKVEVCSVE